MTETGSAAKRSEVASAPHAIAPALETARPTLQPERITSIDALRGVALLGILLLNVQSFAMPGAAYMNPTVYGDLTGVNWWVWYLCHLFADQKFMTIFSMLFGAGIVLMTSRLEARTGHSAAIHYRRMGWLILFGLLHAHLLWYGDILYYYGMCGLAVWLVRKWPPMVQLAFGILLVSVAAVITWLGGWSVQFWSSEAIEAMNVDALNPTREMKDAEIAAYRSGWWGQMAQRVPTSIFFETMLFAIWGVWRVSGLMLVGMALYKWRVFGARRSTWFYLGLVAIGLAGGVPLIMLGVKRNFEADWHASYSMFFGAEFNYWGSLLVSMAWVGVVMLIWKSPPGPRLLRPFAAVGQMALTNYLMQTIICTTIFYGHGLGLFGRLDRTEQLMVVAGVWIVELIWSPLWLSKFRFGPFEWLWRTLTYLKPQPMLR